MDSDEILLIYINGHLLQNYVIHYKIMGTDILYIVGRTNSDEAYIRDVEIHITQDI